MTKSEVFSETDRRALAFAETYWMTYGKTVTPTMLEEGLGQTAKYWSTWLQDVRIISAFNRRAIPMVIVNGLEPNQLALANALLDFADGRSFKKKCSDLGVTTAQYQSWLKLPAFANYLRQRSENLLTDALPEAHMALVDNVRRGDLQSIKFFYEISGRYSSNSAGVDVPMLLTNILEIIAKHIQNPDLLMAISKDFATLDSSGKVGGDVITGEVLSAPVAKEIFP